VFEIYHVVLCAVIVLTFSVRETDEYNATFVRFPIKMSCVRSTTDGSTDDWVLGANNSFLTQL